MCKPGTTGQAACSWQHLRSDLKAFQYEHLASHDAWRSSGGSRADGGRPALMHCSLRGRLSAAQCLYLGMKAQHCYAGWSSKVYEYASNFGIPSETCNAYTAVAASSCSSIDQCYTCSPFDKGICAPLSKYVSAWHGSACVLLLPAHQRAPLSWPHYFVAEACSCTPLHADQQSLASANGHPPTQLRPVHLGGGLQVCELWCRTGWLSQSMGWWQAQMP